MRVEARWASIFTLTDRRFLLRASLTVAVYVVSRLHAHRLRAVLWVHQVCHWTERTLPRAERRAAPHRHPLQAWSKVGSWLPFCMLPNRLVHWKSWLKSDTWPPQIPGRRKPGNGVFREAAYRRSAENQEEVERGQQRQTGAVLLQVNADNASMDVFWDHLQQHNLLVAPSLFKST